MSTLQIRRSFFKKVLMPLLLASFGLAAHAAAQTRMMPLGNSITEGTGSSHDGGYRHDLYYSLQNANVAFDFAGSLQLGTGFPDIDHEGHPGFRADQLNAPTYLLQNPAALWHLRSTELVPILHLSQWEQRAVSFICGMEKERHRGRA